jgi:small subunit ribosomal protein S7
MDERELTPTGDAPLETADADALAAAAAAEAEAKEAEVQLLTGPAARMFGKWDLAEVEIRDPGLKRYINLRPVYLPHTSARHANRPFAKSHVNLVERLINLLMRSEDYTGKKSKAYRAVKEAFDFIGEKTKQNPVQVLIKAIENAAPREEVTRLRYGGISVPKAVDVSPARRLDIALRNIATGATSASFKSPKPIHECLATEIIRASRAEMESFAIARKEELERVAKSAR